MTLQSAISQSPLEKFSTEDEISDEERFSLRLSEGEDEDAGSMLKLFFDSSNLSGLFTFQKVKIKRAILQQSQLQ